MEEKELFLYVGERLTLKTETSYKRYSVFTTMERNSDMLALDGDRLDRFESNCDIIRLDDEVFKKLSVLRKADTREIEYGLSDYIVRGIQASYEELTYEYEFERPKVKKYIKEDYNRI